MTVRSDQVWELSPAYDEHNALRREEVFKTLSNYGAAHHDAWPARAQIIEVLTPTMHPSAMFNYVKCGREGLHRIIAKENMPQVIAWSPHDLRLDVWFIGNQLGNTDGTPSAEWELWAYITTVHQLVVIHLGCNHINQTKIKQSGAYERLRCLDCDYTWGINHNGSTRTV
tara:strand:- start:5143 stop:5652 length:510 start_codon:yes stop_codon:yes gene_type:complete